MKKLAIHSVPRSGSTWLGEILNSSPSTKYCFQPLFSYQLKGFLSAESSNAEVEFFFKELELTDDDFILQKDQRLAGSLPVFDKSEPPTHIVYKEVRYHNVLKGILSGTSQVKFVFLIRDPFSVISSWFAAPREFDPSWDKDDELVYANSKNLGKPEEFYGLAKWVEATKLFVELNEKYPNKTLLVNYSDLAQSTEGTVEKIFEFSELEITEQTMRFIKESQEVFVADPYSVYKGEGEHLKWKNTLSTSQVRTIRQFALKHDLANFL